MTEKIENMSDAAVRKATGRDWAAWRHVLDQAGAQDWSHKQIVAHLSAMEPPSNLSGWWQQTVAVGYEKLTGRRIVGQTADAGFQVGVQRTLPLSLSDAWRLVMSDDAIRDWLGDIGDVKLAVGTQYGAADGTTGEIRVIKPNDRVRLTRQTDDGSPSTLQIALTPVGENKTALRFHHERMRSATEREQMRQHWRAVLDRWIAMQGAIATTPG